MHIMQLVQSNFHCAVCVAYALADIDFELERIDFMLPEDSGNTDIIIRKSVGTRTEVELTVMLDFDILNDMVIQRGIYTYHKSE